MPNVLGNVVGGLAGAASTLTGAGAPLIGAGLAGGGTAAVFGGLMSGLMDGLAQTVVKGAQFLLSRLAKAMTETTRPQLSAQWFVEPFHRMQRMGVALIVAVLAVACIHAIVRQDARLVLRAGFVHLPLAVVLTVAATGIVGWAVAFVDDMCTNFTGGASALDGFADQLGHLMGENGFVALAAALVAVGGGLLLWVELLIRSSAVEVATLFLPLALATMTWPSASRSARRLAEILAALILSKFVVVAVLALGAGAVTHPAAGAADSAGSVLTGIAMLLLACGAPFALMRLAPLAEFAAIGHLEGMSRRVTTRPVMTAWNARALLGAGGPDIGSGVGPVEDPGSASAGPRAAPAMAPLRNEWHGQISGYANPYADRDEAAG